MHVSAGEAASVIDSRDFSTATLDDLEFRNVNKLVNGIQLEISFLRFFGIL